MIRSWRYTKGAGNAAIYLRAKNAGQYWNFSTLAWVAAEAAATKAFLTEYADAGDAEESDFEVSFAEPPLGPWKVEIVEASTGETIAEGNTDVSVLGIQSILSAVGGLTGTHQVTLQFYETATVIPIADISVDVYDSSNTARMNGSSIKADSNGQSTFNRDNGIYKIRGMKAGVTIALGTVTVADGDVTQILYGTTIALPDAPAAGMQTLYGNVRDLNWAATTGDIISATIAEGSQVVGGALIQTNKITAVVDANSQFSFQVPINCPIKLTVPSHGSHDFTTSSVEGVVDVATYLAQ